MTEFWWEIEKVSVTNEKSVAFNRITIGILLRQVYIMDELLIFMNYTV